MNFEIDHLMRYRVSRPVTLHRHVLRVIPRRDTRQRSLSGSISIDPGPIRHREFIETWGITTGRVLYAGQSDLPEIRMQMEAAMTISKEC